MIKSTIKSWDISFEFRSKVPPRNFDKPADKRLHDRKIASVRKITKKVGHLNVDTPRYDK